MYDNGGGSGMWAAIGGGITLIIAALINQMTKGSRKAANANELASLGAETGVIEILRDEVARLSIRLKAVEQESYELKTAAAVLQNKVATLQADLDTEKFRVIQLKRLIDPDKLATLS